MGRPLVIRAHGVGAEFPSGTNIGILAAFAKVLGHRHDTTGSPVGVHGPVPASAPGGNRRLGKNLCHLLRRAAVDQRGVHSLSAQDPEPTVSAGQQEPYDLCQQPPRAAGADFSRHSFAA